MFFVLAKATRIKKLPDNKLLTNKQFISDTFNKAIIGVGVLKEQGSLFVVSLKRQDEQSYGFQDMQTSGPISNHQ